MACSNQTLLDILDNILQEHKNEFHPGYLALGTGGFGRLFKVTKKSDNQPYALKCISLEGNQAKKEKIKKEATFLSMCHHENIVQYYDSFVTETKLFYKDFATFFGLKRCSQEKGVTQLKLEFLFIRMELCEKSLRDIIQYEEIIDFKIRHEYMTNICNGLKYIHGQGLVHRDLKPENILLSGTNPGVLKIADFGLSKNIMGDENNTPYLSPCGTNPYIAPEVLRKRVKNNNKIDMYSLGVIYLEMTAEFQQIFMPLKEVIKNMTAGDLPKEYHFILELLNKDAKKRPDCDKVLACLRNIYSKNFGVNDDRLIGQFNKDLLATNNGNNYFEKIIKEVIQIFQWHGGKMYDLPCYNPYGPHSLAVLDSFGNVVPIADNSRLVFVEYIRQNEPLNPIYCYSLLKKFINSSNIYTLKNIWECTFDIVYPNYKIKKAVRMDMEAEIICLVLEILNKICTNSNQANNIVVHINNKALVEGLLNWVGINTSEIDIDNLLIQYAQGNFTIADYKHKLLEWNICEEMTTLLTAAFNTSQYKDILQEYIKQFNEENQDVNTAFKKLRTLKMFLKNRGMATDNILINCTLFHQYENSGNMFRVFYKIGKELIQIAEGGRYEDLINEPETIENNNNNNEFKEKYLACGVNINIEGINRALKGINYIDRECVLIISCKKWKEVANLIVEELHKREIKTILAKSLLQNYQIHVKCLDDRIEIYNEHNPIKTMNVTYKSSSEVELDIEEVCNAIEENFD